MRYYEFATSGKEFDLYFESLLHEQSILNEGIGDIAQQYLDKAKEIIGDKVKEPITVIKNTKDAAIALYQVCINEKFRTSVIKGLQSLINKILQKITIPDVKTAITNICNKVIPKDFSILTFFKIILSYALLNNAKRLLTMAIEYVKGSDEKEEPENTNTNEAWGDVVNKVKDTASKVTKGYKKVSKYIPDEAKDAVKDTVIDNAKNVFKDILDPDASDQNVVIQVSKWIIEKNNKYS